MAIKKNLKNTNILADLRQARGLTQQELGEWVGVSRQTIISLENGRFKPSLGLAHRLAVYFDTKIEDSFLSMIESSRPGARSGISPSRGAAHERSSLVCITFYGGSNVQKIVQNRTGTHPVRGLRWFGRIPECRSLDCQDTLGRTRALLWNRNPSVPCLRDYPAEQEPG